MTDRRFLYYPDREKDTSAITERTTQELIRLADTEQLSYLKSVYPRLIPLVNELTHSLAAHNKDTHAAFWLMYLKSYNSQAAQIRQSFDAKESDLNFDTSILIDAIKEFFSEVVDEVIEKTKEPIFFQDKEAKDLLDTMVDIHTSDSDQLEYEGFILEIPSRMLKIAQRLQGNGNQIQLNKGRITDDELSWENRPEDMPILTWALLRAHRREPRHILNDEY